MSIARVWVLVASLLASTTTNALRPRVAEPAVDHDGDVATLPTKHRDGVWLPIDMVGLRLRTTVKLNGVDVPVILDTGAQVTVLSREVATLIGLDAPAVVRRPVKLSDFNGRIVDAWSAEIDAVIVGPVRVRGVRAVVADVPPELVAIGYDVLAHTDLYFAVDEGVVGVFAPGKGPSLPRAKRVQMATLAAPLVPGPLDDSGRTTVPFTIDTGSPRTTIEDVKGDAVALPLDERFAGPLPGAHSTSTSTGAYRVERFKLGRERVDLGRVYALRAAQSVLGNDVTMRHRTVLSSERAQITFAPVPIRPDRRSHGPDGVACANGPCARVAIDTKDDGSPCLRLDIDAAWNGRTLEGLVDVLDADSGSAVGGGLFFFHVRVPAMGVHLCTDVDRALATWQVPASSTTSLLRLHTRSGTGCGGDVCLGFTGLTSSSPSSPPSSPSSR
ncbi:MAG TPA: retropepsin-like aspartic protease [Myxococcota bacterium]